MRYLLCGVLVVLLGSCFPMRVVPVGAPPASDLHRLHERLVGERVQVHLLAGGTEHGRVVWIHADTTRWISTAGEVRDEATAEIHAFETVSVGRATLKGGAYGAAAGLPLAALAYAVTSLNNVAFSSLGLAGGERPGVQAAGVIVASTLLGAAVGAASGDRRLWVINER